jgi:hypothetical protein
LKAINFGSLIHINQEEAGAAGSSSAISGIVHDGAVHPSPVAATATVGVAPKGGETEAGASTVSVDFGAQDRAALQAQLALLAAQMAEMADGGEDALAHGLSTGMAGKHTTQVEKAKNGVVHAENDDDDDDMEMVDVPVASDALPS